MFRLEDVKSKPLTGLKKTIVYSSERDKKFIEGVLNIYSIKEKKSPSAVLEDLIEDKVLPQNATAREICKDLYSCEINNFIALRKVFSLYAAGVNNGAKYHNGYELVEYLRKSLDSVTYPSDDASEGDRNYFCSNFNQVYNVIKINCSSDHEDDLHDYESPVRYTKYHLDIASTEPQCFKPFNFTEIVLDHWDILGDNTYTFRALSALCRLLELQKSDHAEDRITLVELIIKLSSDWY